MTTTTEAQQQLIVAAHAALMLLNLCAAHGSRVHLNDNLHSLSHLASFHVDALRAALAQVEAAEIAR